MRGAFLLPDVNIIDTYPNPPVVADQKSYPE